MHGSTWFILAMLPVLLAGAAVASSAETALFSLSYEDRLRLRRLAPRAAERVDALLARPRELLVGLLFANMMITTVYFVLTSMLLIEAAEADARWLGLVVSVVNLLLMTVVAEVVSKMLASRRRVEFARALAGPVAVLNGAMGPMRSFLDAGVIAPLSRLLHPPGAKPAGSLLNEEELTALLELGAGEGAIDSSEQRVLREVIALGQLRVREVMTPRVDLSWLELSAGAGEVRGIAQERGLTRVPVCRESLDDGVVGILDVKSYLAADARGLSPRLEAFLAPAHYVPEAARLDRLLEHLRQTGAKQALCVDEYGVITGAVSTRDIAGRLVAELRDEDSGEEEPSVQLVGLGRWLVSGRLPAREWARMFDLEVDPRVSTVGGLIFSYLGRLPQVGDELVFGNVRVRVERLDRRVVERLLVTLESGAGGREAPGAGGGGA
jgi:putative hemolysin